MPIKLRSLFACFFGMLFVLSCHSGKGDHKEQNNSAMSGGSDAELAVIMRQIHKDAKLLRSQILDSTGFGSKAPDYLRRIVGAETTDPEVKGALFDAFAQAYLENMDALYNESEAHKKELFNSVVNSCINCHGEFCPGPIDTIEKLRFKKTSS